MVTVALSLAALLLITNLPDSCSDSDNSELNYEMESVDSAVERQGALRMHGVPVGVAGRQGPLLR